MRDQLFATQMTQRVLQLHQLDKQIMLRIKSRWRDRRLEVEAQPLLDSESLQLRAALCQIHEQHQVENQWRRQDRVATQEVHFDLHRIAQPPEDINVVPTFFVIATRRIVIDL